MHVAYFLACLAAAQSDWEFKWDCKKTEALSYQVTQLHNKNAQTRFVVFGSELNEDGTNSIGVSSYRDIGFHLLFVLPKGRVKVGAQWNHERTYFDEGIYEGGALVRVKATGSYSFRKIVKEKDVEYGVIEGSFTCFNLRKQPSGKEEQQKKPAGKVDVTYTVNLATGAVEKGSFTMDLNGLDMPEFWGNPVPARFTNRESLVFEEKIQLEDSEKLIVAVNKAIERGAAGLKKMQKPDGSFLETLKPENKVGATGLAVMALLHSGVKVSDNVIQYAFTFMTREFKNSKNRTTYDVACFCMAIETKYLPLGQYEDMANFTEDAAREHLKKNISKEDLDIVTEAASWFESQQMPKGWWGYPAFKEDHDHSNSQYALLALKSCSRCGVKIPSDVWRRAINHWIETQTVTSDKEVKLDVEFFNPKEAGIRGTEVEQKDKQGAWGYYTGPLQSFAGLGSDDIEKRRYGSMTCAGLTSLIICESELSAMGKLQDDKRLQERLEKAKRSGLAWLQEHFSVRTNMPAGQLFTRLYLYYLFSLERVGVLYGIKKFAGHDWYREGAVLLIQGQKSDGTWDLSLLPLPLSDCAFALLFLKKATLKVKTGP